ncbi:MAG: hypothetical protein IT566_07395 [Rhodospirillaceae bacterium]|nr:hypothetical protein [Rhodospirillaceae bacterium]
MSVTVQAYSIRKGNKLRPAGRVKVPAWLYVAAAKEERENVDAAADAAKLKQIYEPRRRAKRK